MVSNKAGAGGTAAVEYLMSSVAPDGLHIGYFAGTPIRYALGLQQVPEGTGELPWVAARSVNQIFVARTETGLNESSAVDFDQPLFMATNSPDNHVAIRARMLADTLGITEFDIISGYRGQGNMVAAVRAKEVDLAITNDSYFGSNREALIADGTISSWGQMGEYVDGSIISQKGMEDIPVFDQMWRAASPNTLDTPVYQAWEAIHIAMSIQNIFVLPPNTPEEYIPVWEEAILAAYNDPEYHAQLKEVGIPVPSAVGTEDVLQRMTALRETFSDENVVASVADVIARNTK